MSFNGFITYFCFSILGGRASSIAFMISSISIHYNSVAISKIVLFISWPTCSDSTVVDSSLDKIDMISIATYLK